jgi:hypothetical protein
MWPFRLRAVVINPRGIHVLRISTHRSVLFAMDSHGTPEHSRSVVFKLGSLWTTIWSVKLPCSLCCLVVAVAVAVAAGAMAVRVNQRASVQAQSHRGGAGGVPAGMCRWPAAQDRNGTRATGQGGPAAGRRVIRCTRPRATVGSVRKRSCTLSVSRFALTWRPLWADCILVRLANLVKAVARPAFARGTAVLAAGGGVEGAHARAKACTRAAVDSARWGPLSAVSARRRCSA